MGAKYSMLLYSDAEIRPVLQQAPPPDRDATRALVERLYPSHRLVRVDDGNLRESCHPSDNQVYAGCFPGLTVVCTEDAALDKPSQLAERFRAEARGRTLHLHASHSVADWFAYAVWNPDGTLRRSLSLAPDFGIIENLGNPLPFEAPYWNGERVLDEVLDDELADAEAYPLPFYPLDMGRGCAPASVRLRLRGRPDGR